MRMWRRCCEPEALCRLRLSRWGGPRARSRAIPRFAAVYSSAHIDRTSLLATRLDLSGKFAQLLRDVRGVIGVLRELIGDFAIEDLPVSFTAVATDLASGEEVWLPVGTPLRL